MQPGIDRVCLWVESAADLVVVERPPTARPGLRAVVKRPAFPDEQEPAARRLQAIAKDANDSKDLEGQVPSASEDAWLPVDGLAGDCGDGLGPLTVQRDLEH
jgi:hypothetical protein